MPLRLGRGSLVKAAKPLAAGASNLQCQHAQAELQDSA